MCVVERFGFLGGLLTGWLAEPVCTYVNASGKPVASGVWSVILDRLAGMDGTPGTLIATGNPPWGERSSVTPVDFEALKALLFQLADEFGIDLYLHTHVVSALENHGAMRGLVIHGKGGLEVLQSTVVIDATGDGDVAASAGVPFTTGRGDGYVMPMTVHLRVGGVDVDALRSTVERDTGNFRWHAFLEAHDGAATPYLACSGFLREVAAAKQSGQLTLGREGMTILPCAHAGEYLVNATRVSDVDPLSARGVSDAEREARRQVVSLWRFLPTLPGFEKCTVLQTGMGAHVRESRHPKGEHILSGDEIVSGVPFPDSIGRGAHPVDIHNVTGGGSTWRALARGEYAIPYRSLLPVNVDGLLLAGRCISADHAAAASLRITPTPFVTGEAAGTAAAMAFAQQIEPRKLDPQALQARLRKHSAIL